MRKKILPKLLIAVVVILLAAGLLSAITSMTAQWTE